MSESESAVRTIRRFVFPVFFASGGCALIYQVIWTRQLSLIFGVSVYAISAVLGSFMAGLALGSWLFGRRSDGVTRPVRLYGLLEGGIGIYALLFPLIITYITRPLFIWAGGLLEPASPSLQGVRLLIALGSLIVPTTLMGGTFPVMSRFFVRLRSRAGRDISLLYAINTVGAVAGTVLVGFLLLSFFGITATLCATALVNLALAAVAIGLSRREPHPATTGDLTAPAVSTDSPGPAGGPAAFVPTPGMLRLCLAVILLSGFASLACEVLWTRVLTFYTHNSTFAFSAMLATFLVGLSIGSWLIGLVLDRIHRRLAWFGWLEAALAVSVTGSVLVVERLPGVMRVAFTSLGLQNWGVALLYIFGQTALVLLLPAIILGAIFPLATRIYTTGLGTVGRQVGAVYAANTLGAIFGSLGAGFIMIPLFGVRSSFLVIIGLNFLLAGVLLVCSGTHRGWKLFRLTAVALIGLACWAQVPEKIFYRNYVARFGEVLFYKEEASDTVMVAQAAHRPNSRMIIFADGRGTAGHPTVMEDRFYGHLPMLLHDDVQDVLVICFGVGNTVGAIGRHPEVQRIDIAELSPGVVECSRFFDTNERILEDPRVNLTIEDGRNFLLTTDRKYDLIHLDPPEIHTAGVVNLYTREFYELCRDHLKPNGILSHWVNVYLLPEKESRMLAGTVQDVFPHTTVWQGPRHYSFNFICSDSELSIDLEGFRRRMAVPAVRQSLAEVHLDDQYDLLSLHLLSEESLRRFVGDVPLVTDDRTRVDFSVPRSIYSGFGFKHFFSAHSNLYTVDGMEHDPRERGGRLGLLSLSLDRDSVAPRVVLPAAPTVTDPPEPAFEALLEERIEKRLDQYRVLIEHDPDCRVLDSWRTAE